MKHATSLIRDSSLFQEVRLTEHFNRNSADVFSSARIKATYNHAMAVVKREVRITG